MLTAPAFIFCPTCPPWNNNTPADVYIANIYIQLFTGCFLQIETYNDILKRKNSQSSEDVKAG